MKLLEHYVAKSGEVIYLNHRGEMKVAGSMDEFKGICFQETLFWIQVNKENRIGIPLREQERIAYVMGQLDNARYLEVVSEYTELLMKGIKKDYE